MFSLDKPRPHSQLPKENLLSLFELANQAPSGNIVEVGVYKGGSAWVLYQVTEQRNTKLYLFDTFTGLPRERVDQQMGAGAFSDTTKEEVQDALPNARIFKGLFPDTLTDEVQNISFIHIDCDLMNGCRGALEHLWPRMIPGGIMAFDDWGFDEIRLPVIDKFGKSAVEFSKVRIPYVVKK